MNLHSKGILMSQVTFEVVTGDRRNSFLVKVKLFSAVVVADLLQLFFLKRFLCTLTFCQSDKIVVLSKN